MTVYCDRHPPNEWGEHVHSQLQGVVLLNEVVCVVRWRTDDGVLHEQAIDGPAVWVIPAGMPHALICPQEADMVTVCSYIVRRRVEKAQELLETTDLKEIDIAHACGFSDDTSLARAFRRILHCTPREIRQKRAR